MNAARESAMNAYWAAKTRFILASQSASRLKMLADAGLHVKAHPADIDERRIAGSHLKSGGDPHLTAMKLAEAKALDVSRKHPGCHVLGADQTLTMDGREFHKVKTLPEAARQLQQFSGKTHVLTSAAALALDGRVVIRETASAAMTMRLLTPAFIEIYLQAAGEQILDSVGCYQIEGHGIQLFERIEGDQFTIMGLPLLQLLQAMRLSNIIAS